MADTRTKSSDRCDCATESVGVYGYLVSVSVMFSSQCVPVGVFKSIGLSQRDRVGVLVCKSQVQSQVQIFRKVSDKEFLGLLAACVSPLVTHQCVAKHFHCQTFPISYRVCGADRGPKLFRRKVSR